MPEPTSVTALVDALDVDPIEATIPGSAPPVTIHRLLLEPDGAPQSVVRFPAGWTRPVTGAYDQIEEVLWLEGSFTMSGQTHRPDTYTWFPVNYVRVDSSAPDGALAFAWFSGKTTWTVDPDPELVQQDPVIRHWPDVLQTDNPLGEGWGRFLHDAGGRAAWIIEGVQPGRVAPTVVHLFSIPSRQWAEVQTGDGLPDLPGPLFARLMA